MSLPDDPPAQARPAEPGAPEPALAAARPGDFRSGPPTTASSGPPPIPEALAPFVPSATWDLVWVKAGSEVWKATTGGVARYLKIGAAGGADGTGAEAARLAWLAGRALAPGLLAHVVEGGTGWLLTAVVEGVPAQDPRHRMTSVQPLVEALGRGLRQFHDALPVAECPFDATNELLLASARRRVAAGGVDPSTLEPAYARYSAVDLLGHLEAMRPYEPAEDLVVAHGDPGLPNMLIDPGSGTLTGIVDVGRLGVSDRYRDLGIAARSLVKNLGPEVLHLLFDAYGNPHPDPRRLDFYVLLDDLW